MKFNFEAVEWYKGESPIKISILSILVLVIVWVGGGWFLWHLWH